MRSLAERFQGSEATGMGHGLIAQFLQHPLAYTDKRLLIIDKQNHPFASGERFVPTGGGVNHHVKPRQIDFACGALSWRTLEPDRSTMTGDNPMHHCQSHACALSHALRGKKRFKDAADDLWRDTVPRVTDD